MAMENEIGNIFQGIRGIKGTEKCIFIHRHEVPQEINVTYIRIVCDIRTHKKETHRVRLSVGGNNLTYDDPVSSPTSDLIMTKLPQNRILSTPEEKYLIVDENNFILNNPMKKVESYRIVIKLITKYIIDKYDLNNNQKY